MECRTIGGLGIGGSATTMTELIPWGVVAMSLLLFIIGMVIWMLGMGPRTRHHD